jgi:hypothetical protein
MVFLFWLQSYVFIFDYPNSSSLISGWKYFGKCLAVSGIIRIFVTKIELITKIKKKYEENSINSIGLLINGHGECRTSFQTAGFEESRAVHAREEV